MKGGECAELGADVDEVPLPGMDVILPFDEEGDGAWALQVLPEALCGGFIGFVVAVSAGFGDASSDGVRFFEARFHPKVFRCPSG